MFHVENLLDQFTISQKGEGILSYKETYSNYYIIPKNKKNKHNITLISKYRI